MGQDCWGDGFFHIFGPYSGGEREEGEYLMLREEVRDWGSTFWVDSTKVCWCYVDHEDCSGGLSETDPKN